MRINYNVKGNERKELVEAVSKVLICKAKYLGAPSFSYEMGLLKLLKLVTSQ
jgi:hypothetical protein